MPEESKGKPTRRCWSRKTHFTNGYTSKKTVVSLVAIRRSEEEGTEWVRCDRFGVDSICHPIILRPHRHCDGWMDADSFLLADVNCNTLFPYLLLFVYCCWLLLLLSVIC